MIRREPGNEYINSYVPLINSIFKTNHDIKFLASREGGEVLVHKLLSNLLNRCVLLGPEKAFYIMKYTAKPQLDLENPLALHLAAFDKAKSKQVNAPDDPIAAGRKCIQSMCCSLSNPHEVSAPLAGLYILQGSPFYSSHEFVKLYLKAVIDTVFEDATMAVMLQQNQWGATFSTKSIFLDYVERPTELESVCLMDFAAEWTRARNSTGYRFSRQHAQFKSHSVHQRLKRRVVTVINERLPDTRNLLTGDRLTTFRRAISILYRAFRRDEDFGQRSGSFSTDFEVWWASDLPITAQKYVAFNNDYYSSREIKSDVDTARVASYTFDGYDVSDNMDGVCCGRQKRYLW